jgi:hypothetical protein
MASQNTVTPPESVALRLHRPKIIKVWFAPRHPYIIYWWCGLVDHATGYMCGQVHPQWSDRTGQNPRVLGPHSLISPCTRGHFTLIPHPRHRRPPNPHCLSHIRSYPTGSMLPAAPPSGRSDCPHHRHHSTASLLLLDHILIAATRPHPRPTRVCISLTGWYLSF